MLRRKERKHIITAVPLKKRFFTVLLFVGCCLFYINTIAQNNLLPPDQPEQDACTALDLCGTTFFTPYSYQGNGSVTDIANTIWGEGEVNALWIRVHIKTSGKLMFKIIPVNSEDDYDFAVINATGIDCSKITSDNIVRVNFNNDYAGSNYLGIVGLSDTATTSFIPAGTYGYSFIKSIDALANETYLIMINNFGTYRESGIDGFTIDFTGSTVNFKYIDPVVISTISNPCSDDSIITLHLSEDVLCSSIAADGSDFIIDPPLNITSVTGTNCLANGGYTNEIKLHFSNKLLYNTEYRISTKQGTDNNTMLNLCDESMSLSFTTSFVTSGPDNCIFYFYVPTAFTPNKDGKNDVFKPSFQGNISQYNLVVYNRWGKIVFRSNDPTKGWDGTMNAQQQPPGTYVWICSYKPEQSNVVTRKGTLVLFR